MSVMSESKIRKNQVGDDVIGADPEMTKDRWEEWWEEGKTQFHMPVVHPMLSKYIDTLTGGKEALTIFLPLSGKSVDLMWLAEKGHSVIGTEWVELGCRQFFQDNDLDYVVEDLNFSGVPGKVLKSTEADADISLYCCNAFQLTTEIIGSIDCIWDRGSLAAIDRKDRTRYAQVITSLMSKPTRYLVDTFRVDNDVFAGPPHNISADDLNQLFGSSCSLKLLETRDAMTDWTRSWGVKYFEENAHFIQLLN